MVVRPKASRYMSTMVKMSSVGLINTSYVFIVEANNPNMFSADLLKTKGVVSADATVTQNLVLPPFAQIAFDDGLVFEALESRIKLEITFPEPVALDEYQVDTDPVNTGGPRLAEEIAVMRLRSVGINFRVLIEGVVLANLASDVVKQFQVNGLNLDGAFNDFRLNLALSHAVHEGGQKGIMIDFNYDGQGAALGVEASLTQRLEVIQGFLAQRKACGNDVRRVLDALGI